MVSQEASQLNWITWIFQVKVQHQSHYTNLVLLEYILTYWSKFKHEHNFPCTCTLLSLTALCIFYYWDCINNCHAHDVAGYGRVPGGIQSRPYKSNSSFGKSSEHPFPTQILFLLECGAALLGSFSSAEVQF